MLVKFLPNGQPDVSFGGTGQRLYDFGAGKSGEFTDIRIQPDRKIITCGVVSESTGKLSSIFGRYQTDGSPDPEVGQGDGFTTYAFSTAELARDWAKRLLLVSPDKAVLTGWAIDSENENPAYLARILLGDVSGLTENAQMGQFQVWTDSENNLWRKPISDGGWLNIQSISLYHAGGGLIQSGTSQIGTEGSICLSLPRALAPGFYTVIVETDQGTRSESLIISH